MTDPSDRPPAAFPDSLVAGLLTRCTFPPAGTALPCAVSGGADSLALLVLAAAAGCDVTAFHVDHGLRPGSAEEGDVVAAVAQRVGARCERRRAVVTPGPNLEARARQARFALLPAGVATGHTMDDQAETILVNLLRGAGSDGLAGMAPGARHPLLGLRRSETHALCAAAGLEPVCDASNDDPAFVRNRVRHELLPLCAAVAGRDPVPLLVRQAGVLRDEVGADGLPGPGRAARPRRRPGGGGHHPPVGASRALRRWLRGAGDGHPPSLAEVDRVLDVAAGAAVGTELSGGRRVRRTAGRLRVEPERSTRVQPVTDEPGAGVPGAGRPERACRPGPSPTSARCWSRRTNWPSGWPSWGPGSRRTTPTSRPCWWPCSRARCSS